MLNFKEHNDHIETDLAGKNILTVAQLNKGTAFTYEERIELGLLGKLPSKIETLDEQVERAYLQFSKYAGDDFQKHIYLNNLHDKNQILFYKLVNTHLEEMVPLIYTPCIATAVKQYSNEFRQPRGLFISYEDRDHLDAILDNRTNPDIDILVVTDGEGVLGIGDQGVGSINIPIAKLMVYTLFAGISPLRTLPIYLDVGTNNPEHLNNPFYLGTRHPRLSQAEYDEFIEKFIAAVQRKFPTAFLHWEDFGINNARRILDKYQLKACSFNDDIQGTGVVTLAALLAAIKKSGTSIKDQRIIIFGAGSAGVGIADQIYQALVREGLSETQAREKFWLFNRTGLLTLTSEHLTDAQKKYTRSDLNNISFKEAIHIIKPTILIGASTQPGAFSEEIVKTMANYVERPIIFPLSNPTEKSEAVPANLMTWTNGKALVATGSPFPNTPQCNNALAFPGIGLGIIASRAKLLTDEMLWAACKALSQFSGESLLPTLAHAKEAAIAIAKAVAQTALEQNLARVSITNLDTHIRQLMWEPKYLPVKLK